MHKLLLHWICTSPGASIQMKRSADATSLLLLPLRCCCSRSVIEQKARASSETVYILQHCIESMCQHQMLTYMAPCVLAATVLILPMREFSLFQPSRMLLSSLIWMAFYCSVARLHCFPVWFVDIFRFFFISCRLSRSFVRPLIAYATEMVNHVISHYIFRSSRLYSPAKQCTHCWVWVSVAHTHTQFCLVASLLACLLTCSLVVLLICAARCMVRICICIRYSESRLNVIFIPKNGFKQTLLN